MARRYPSTFEDLLSVKEEEAHLDIKEEPLDFDPYEVCRGGPFSIDSGLGLAISERLQHGGGGRGGGRGGENGGGFMGDDLIFYDSLDPYTGPPLFETSPFQQQQEQQQQQQHHHQQPQHQHIPTTLQSDHTSSYHHLSEGTYGASRGLEYLGGGDSGGDVVGGGGGGGTGPMGVGGVGSNPAGGPMAPMNPEQDPALRKISSDAKRNRLRGPTIWEFLLRLLEDPASNSSVIRWEDEADGVFRLVNPAAIAHRWGSRQRAGNSDGVVYDNFARGIRYHYNTGYLEPIKERHLVYKFSQKALDKWRGGAGPY